MGCHLLLPLVAFWTRPGPSVLPLQPSREAASIPEGAAASAQRRATDGTPVIQSEQMALLPRGVGVAAAPVPTPARGSDQAARQSPAEESRSCHHSGELGEVGRASENPACCYFELLESLPLSAPVQTALPFNDALPSPFGVPTVCQAWAGGDSMSLG